MPDATGTVRGAVRVVWKFSFPTAGAVVEVQTNERDDALVFHGELPVAIVPLTPEAHAARVDAVTRALRYSSQPMFEGEARAILAALGLEDA